MLFFKHAELAAQYHVSLKTVHNWIDEARQDKINLELYLHNGRTYVANNPSNIATLDRLVEERKKYRNNVHHKTATPTAEFYKLFNKRQVVDIITNLTVHREIPRQYNYFGKGADNWDEYIQSLAQKQELTAPKASRELLHANLDKIDLLLKDYKKVNVIDIGVGNALPVREFLGHLLSKGVLHRYIALDVSPQMLNIAEKNIKDWFGDAISYEGYIKDITHERFDDILVEDRLRGDETKTINVVLFLGGTPLNLRSPQASWKIICDSLDQNDIMVYEDKPDSSMSRRFFNFSAQTTSNGLSPNHRTIFDLLNIDESLYDVEMGYNSEKRMRYIQVRLKAALTLSFKINSSIKNIDFQKGDAILLWRFWHFSALEILQEFENSGFEMLHATFTPDRQYMMTISGINSDIEPSAQ